MKKIMEERMKKRIKFPMKTLVIIFLYILFTKSFSLLFSQNYMEIIAELTGEHRKSKFGYCLASLDFNGDDIDDLVVGADKWDPEWEGQGQPFSWGRLYFFWGDEDSFADSVSLTLSEYVNQNTNIAMNIEALGDLNNDGFDDLGYFSSYYTDQPYYCSNILFGNAVNDTIPAITFIFPNTEFSSEHLPRLHKLGDINGDGFDDAGLTISKRYPNSEIKDVCYIIYGHQLTLQYLCVFDQFSPSTGIISFNGIGDVNLDGYDDFILGYRSSADFTKLLFYGDTINDSIPDIILTNEIANPYLSSGGGVPVGDWNGDGIPDFNGGLDQYGHDIWFGNTNQISQNFRIEFWDPLFSRNHDYGDVNSDGKSDFLGGRSGPQIGSDGEAFLYLGSQNGLSDLHLELDHVIGINFGYAVAIGDFNNDGYDDVAISGHGEYGGGLNDGWNGKVMVYAGNPDLSEADPNISNHDEVLEKPEIIFNAYPNPFNSTINFEIETYEIENFELSIFNVKGQLLERIEITEKEFNWSPNDTSSGVYFCNLMGQNSKFIKSKKIILLK
jgi:hypothetical protein